MSKIMRLGLNPGITFTLRFSVTLYEVTSCMGDPPFVCTIATRSRVTECVTRTRSIACLDGTIFDPSRFCFYLRCCRWSIDLHFAASAFARNRFSACNGTTVTALLRTTEALEYCHQILGKKNNKRPEGRFSQCLLPSPRTCLFLDTSDERDKT